MAYKILLPQLHATADAARRHFADILGVSESRFEIEVPIGNGINYVPTFKVQSREKHLVVIEVAESIPQSLLSAVVLAMRNEAFPCKVYVAIPEGPQTQTFKDDLKLAKQNGIGLLECGTGVMSYQDALLLNLTGVRRPRTSDFPRSLRTAVASSSVTFENGNPKKACSTITDEIEGLTRRIAALARKKGALKPNTPKFTPKTPWATIADILYRDLDLKIAPFNRLDAPLLARVRALTPHRNDSNHPPKNLKARQKIDLELRTRYEHACDVLRDLGRASPTACLT